MARYKPVEYAQGQFISIAFEHQVLPGSFEHALNYIVDNKIDFAILDGAHENDDVGALQKHWQMAMCWMTIDNCHTGKSAEQFARAGESVD